MAKQMSGKQMSGKQDGIKWASELKSEGKKEEKNAGKKEEKNAGKKEEKKECDGLYLTLPQALDLFIKQTNEAMEWSKQVEEEDKLRRKIDDEAEILAKKIRNLSGKDIHDVQLNEELEFMRAQVESLREAHEEKERKKIALIHQTSSLYAAIEYSVKELHSVFDLLLTIDLDVFTVYGEDPDEQSRQEAAIDKITSIIERLLDDARYGRVGTFKELNHRINEHVYLQDPIIRSGEKIHAHVSLESILERLQALYGDYQIGIEWAMDNLRENLKTELVKLRKLTRDVRVRYMDREDQISN
jgi:hypothetical protein